MFKRKISDCNHPLYAWPTDRSLDPLEKACLVFADKAHKGQFRKKAVRHEYITHPILALKVLHAVGVNDWITTGAVLTHDCLEQGKVNNQRIATDTHVRSRSRIRRIAREKFDRLIARYLPKEQLDNIRNDFLNDVDLESASEKRRSFTEELTTYCEKALSTLSIPDDKKKSLITLYASMVEGVVTEVSNSEDVESKIASKRFEQILKSERFSRRAKIVKMADFAASLIDDVILPPVRADGTFKTPEERRDFIHRAWSITKECEDAHPLLGALVEQLVRCNLGLLDEPDKREDIVQKFSLDVMVDFAEATLPHKTPKAAIWINNPLDGKLERGVEGTKFEENGITNFRVVINPLKEKKNAANHMLWALVQELEHKTGSTTHTGNITITPHYNVVMKMKFDIPVSPQDFIECAQRVGAMDTEYANLIEEKAKQEALPKATISTPYAQYQETVDSRGKKIVVNQDHMRL